MKQNLLTLRWRVSKLISHKLENDPFHSGGIMAISSNVDLLASMNVGWLPDMVGVVGEQAMCQSKYFSTLVLGPTP